MFVVPAVAIYGRQQIKVRDHKVLAVAVYGREHRKLYNINFCVKQVLNGQLCRRSSLRMCDNDGIFFARALNFTREYSNTDGK